MRTLPPVVGVEIAFLMSQLNCQVPAIWDTFSHATPDKRRDLFPKLETVNWKPRIKIKMSPIKPLFESDILRRDYDYFFFICREQSILIE